MRVGCVPVVEAYLGQKSIERARKIVNSDQIRMVEQPIFQILFGGSEETWEVVETFDYIDERECRRN